MRKLFPAVFILVLTCCADEPIKDDFVLDFLNGRPYTSIDTVNDSTVVARLIRGDSITQYIIDLDHSDNFDNSYTATCFYRRKTQDTTVQEGFPVWFGVNCKAIFKPDAIIALDSVNLNRLEPEELQNLKNSVIAFKEKKGGPVSYNSGWYRILFENNVPFKLIDSTSAPKEGTLLCESYKTEFSGGCNYYLITTRGDTTQLLHDMYWIR